MASLAFSSGVAKAPFKARRPKMDGAFRRAVAEARRHGDLKKFKCHSSLVSTDGPAMIRFWLDADASKRLVDRISLGT